MTPPMQITADEINCLIYSYLQDSGFQHTAFSLRIEGHLDASPYASISIRRGELVELLAKALLYSEVEAHWRADEVSSNCSNSFSLLQDHACTFDGPLNGAMPLQPVAETESPRLQLQTVARENIPLLNGDDKPQKRKAGESVAEGKVLASDRKPHILDKDAPRVDSISENEPQQSSTMEVDAKGAEKTLPQPTDEFATPAAVTLLKGHRTEVFVCAWNPIDPRTLATGAKDGTLRLWRFHPWTYENLSSALGPRELTQDDVLSTQSIEMKYMVPDEQADVTTVEWSPSGTLLASGSFDGLIRIWTNKGVMFMFKQQHEGPIFSVKFSATGNWLLTAGMDGTVCVWDVNRKQLYKQIRCHDDPCLDVDWLDNSIFASGSADKSIRIFDISDVSSTPLSILSGHENEVNQLKCNASKTLLASCSDDHSAKIWGLSKYNRHRSDGNMPQDNGNQAHQTPLHTLTGHTDSIGSISWCPSGKHSEEILATASFDATCRLWDALSGDCLRVFADNQQPVFTLSFNAEGSMLATGGGDGLFHLYDMKTKTQLWKWETDRDAPGVFEIEWQEDGRIAVCLENQCVALVDVSKVIPNK